MKTARPIILAVIIAVASTLAAHAAASTNNAKTYHISGMIVSAAGGDPIPGADVAIGESQKSDVLAAVSTGSDGSFDFPALKPGKYWLIAEGRNFSRQGYQQHDNYFTGIAVGSNLPSTGLIFRVTPDASISGTVTDDAGDPVGEARLLLFRSGVDEGRRGTSLRSQTTTDDLGKYRFSHLEPGAYLVAVSGRPWYAQFVNSAAGDAAPDAGSEQRSPIDVAFPVTYYAGTTDGEQATPIDVRGGDRTTADIQLTAVPALHLVVDGIDDSKAGVSVSMVQQVLGTSLPPVGSQVAALPNGQYEISGIAPGQYTAMIQTYGQSASSRQRQIDLSQDAEITTAETSPSSQITGVLTLNNQPFGKGGVLRLTNRDTGEALQGVADAKGTFTINEENVSAGRYDVALFNLPDVAVKSISAAGAKVTGLSLEVPHGGTVQLSVALSQGLGQIEGTVLRQGSAFSGAMVVLVPKDMENNIGLLRRDQSDSDGTFALRDVVPGQYTVLALENGWNMEWRTRGVLDPFLSRGQEITMNGEGKLQLKIEVQ